MTTDWLPIERGAGLEGLKYNAMARRLLRRHVALMNDPTDRRRRCAWRRAKGKRP